MGIIFSLIPENSKINKSNYICDKKFALDDIKDLVYNDKNQIFYALVIMNARETHLMLANDYEIKQVKKIELNVANSHQKGGSSAGRFDRIFEGKRDRNDSYQVETILKEYYNYDINRPNVSGFIIGGSAETRKRVFEDPALSVLKDYIVANIPYDSINPYRLYKETEKLRREYEQTLERAKIEEIDRIAEMNPELLCFGKEIHTMASQSLLKKCFVSSEKLNTMYEMYKVSNKSGLAKALNININDLIEVFDSGIEKWGDIIGIIRHYVALF